MRAESSNPLDGSCAELLPQAGVVTRRGPTSRAKMNRFRLLAAIPLALGLLSLPQPAQAYAHRTLAVRGCGSYGLDDTGRVCMKVYAKRQKDGTGWRIKQMHVYAYSLTASGARACGPRFNDPAGDPGHLWTVNENANGIRYNSFDPGEITLSDSDDCERFYFAGPSGLVVPTDKVEVHFTFHARLTTSPDQDKHFRILFFIPDDASDGDIGSFICSGSDIEDCERR